MRLFVGISIPEDVQARVRALVEIVRPLAALKWSRIADLHVTTKFIGELPSARLAAIEHELGTLRWRAPFHLSLRGVGWFPNAGAPRIFWAGVDAPVALTELATDIDRALSTLGIPRERRAFAPHVTLARVPVGAPLEALRRSLESLPSLKFGGFAADCFTLYESREADSLEHYRALATFPLSG